MSGGSSDAITLFRKIAEGEDGGVNLAPQPQEKVQKPVDVGDEAYRNAVRQQRKNIYAHDVFPSVVDTALVTALAGGGAAAFRGLYKKLMQEEDEDKVHLGELPIATKSANENSLKDALSSRLADSAVMLEDLFGRDYSLTGPPRSGKDTTFSLPAHALAASAGLGAGYLGVNKIVDFLKKKELQDDLSEAQQEFDAALRAQTGMKQASDGIDLDALYDEFEKSAERGSTLSKGMNRATAGAASIASLIWLLTHMTTYDKLRKSDPEALQMKMLKRRRLADMAANPPPVTLHTELPPSKRDLQQRLESAMDTGLAAGRKGLESAGRFGAARLDDLSQLAKRIKLPKLEDEEESFKLKTAADLQIPENLKSILAMKGSDGKPVAVSAADALGEDGEFGSSIGQQIMSNPDVQEGAAEAAGQAISNKAKGIPGASLFLS